MPADAPPTAPPGGPIPLLVQQLAPVRRTLEWALLEPPRLAASPDLGAGCAWRVARIQAATPDEPTELIDLEALHAALVAIDEGDAGDRAGRVEAALALVVKAVPTEIAGALVPVPAAKATLVEPRKRKKRRDDDGGGRKRKGKKRRREPDEPADTAPPADDSAGPASDAGEAPTERPPKRGRNGRERAPRARSEAPEAAPEASPEPAVVRLSFGHADGTGQVLASRADVDPAFAEVLDQHDVVTVADLLLLPPERQVRAPRVSWAPLSTELVTLRGKVVWRRMLLSPGGRRLELRLDCRDGRTVDCRWVLGSPRGWEGWSSGSDLAFVGEVVEGDDGYLLYEAEPVGLDGRGSGILPVYGLDGVDDRTLRDMVATCLSEHIGRIDDWMPQPILDDQRLLPLDQALRDAHFPANAEGRGRVRLAYEELLLIQLGIGWRAGRGTTPRGVSHKALHKGVGQLGAQHHITLKDGQEIAFSEIRRDLLQPAPMTRLLQGDVGAGKSLVTLMAGIMVAENSHQVAMIAPDALAAERRYLHAEGLLRSLAVVPLLVGEAPDRAAADAIRRGEAHIVFGTPALLDAEVTWRRLGLVVAEERSPYGDVTRDRLADMPHQPDLLVVTRTPIPSSLVFTVFGDFDVSVVSSEEPLTVTSLVHKAGEREVAYEQARAAVDAGKQAFVVFPVREGKDLLGRADALRMAKALQGDGFPGARIGIYSSEMSREERTRVFDDFQHRRVDVLVCTTYIEDSPSVANATVMVVEYADLHDLVRLHRLRGHVGQGWASGVCHYILSDSPAEGDIQRVNTVTSERDGFRLAEIDLEVRGHEALLGDRADEMPEMRWAEPARDRHLLLRARTEAFRLLQRDPGLRRSKALARAVHHRWGDWLDRVLPVPDQKRLGATDSKKGRRRRRRRRR